MYRPLKITTFMKMALILAEQATCPKRQVACILLNKDYRIIGSGYNGVASGEPHCTGKDCACIHAEVNAISQCEWTNDVTYVVTTCAPCVDCFAKIMTYLPYIETIYWNEESKNSCKMIGCNSQQVDILTQIERMPRCFESQPSADQQVEAGCSDCPVVLECLGVLR